MSATPWSIETTNQETIIDGDYTWLRHLFILGSTTRLFSDVVADNAPGCIDGLNYAHAGVKCGVGHHSEDWSRCRGMPSAAISGCFGTTPSCDSIL